MKRLTTEEYINKSNHIHGNVYEHLTKIFHKYSTTYIEQQLPE